MFNRHQEPWGWVELGGYCLALAGGQMVGHGICRVNRHFSKRLFSGRSAYLSYLQSQLMSEQVFIFSLLPLPS